MRHNSVFSVFWPYGNEYLTDFGRIWLKMTQKISATNQILGLGLSLSVVAGISILRPKRMRHNSAFWVFWPYGNEYLTDFVRICLKMTQKISATKQILGLGLWLSVLAGTSILRPKRMRHNSVFSVFLARMKWILDRFWWDMA